MHNTQMNLAVAVVSTFILLATTLPQTGGFSFQDNPQSTRQARVGGDFQSKSTPDPAVIHYATSSGGNYNYHKYYSYNKQTRKPATRPSIGGWYFPDSGSRDPVVHDSVPQPSTVSSALKPQTVTIVNGIGIRGGDDFPTETPPTTTAVNLPPPHCPQGEDFCSNVTNYPVDLVQSLVSNIHKEIIDFAKYEPTVDERYHSPGGGSDIPACKSRMDAYFPKAARNIQNDLNWIVNDIDVNGVNFKQRIDTETCLKPRKPCTSLLQAGVAQGFTTECRQSYVNVKLLAIDQKSKQKVVDTFKFPSHCQCFVVPTSFKLSRSGVPQGTVTPDTNTTLSTDSSESDGSTTYINV